MVEDIVRQKGYLTLGSRLRRIGERLQAETQKVMADHDVPVQAGHYPLLAALDEQGPLSVNELVEALGVSQPGVTRSVGQLAKQGIVSVQRGKTDQRTRLVGLTDRGRDIVAQGREYIWPRIESGVAGLMAGQDGPLLEQLDHLEAALDEASLLQRITRTGGSGGNG
ncbi:MarR family winged helix-turn-helix transcriptional regulator [Pseudoruegeria sp. HB172150]|uniref:MarR family winged helix-turn-helix transcriptional regulator n=1 Tax=Pseudoruegeria sp. HB172150 TaxID=2721164 RepID=UPI0015572690|nr:MarR family transcriptional regulator [Pseudoruegeria sp. HB172150]